MEILVGNNNCLPFDTDDEKELWERYNETLSSLGDLIYYGKGYINAVDSVEALFDIDIEYLSDALQSKNSGWHKQDIYTTIDSIIEDLMFSFFIKCIKPMDNLKYINIIRKFIEEDVNSKIGVFDDDTIDFAYSLIDKVVEKLDGAVEYSDNYKKYLKILSNQ